LLCSCKQAEDNPFGYDVNSIAKLQKVVFFKIVVPTHFPHDIIPYPSEIWGPSQDPISNSIGFGLVYRVKKGSERSIRWSTRIKQQIAELFIIKVNWLLFEGGINGA
jgi:hypothetical protein